METDFFAAALDALVDDDDSVVDVEEAVLCVFSLRTFANSLRKERVVFEVERPCSSSSSSP